MNYIYFTWYYSTLNNSKIISVRQLVQVNLKVASEPEPTAFSRSKVRSCMGTVAFHHRQISFQSVPQAQLTYRLKVTYI